MTNETKKLSDATVTALTIMKATELDDATLDRVTGGAIYMQFGNISGEVTTNEHARWIEL